MKFKATALFGAYWTYKRRIAQLSNVMTNKNRQIRGSQALSYSTSVLKQRGEWQPTPPESPQLEWREHHGKVVPFSITFNDFYASCEGSFEESSYVFLEGNKLKERFKKEGELRIAELGFGFGLNFLVSAYHFIHSKKEAPNSPLPNSWLSFTSFERYLPKRKDFEKFYSLLSLPKEIDSTLFNKLSKSLIRQLPENTAGAHRISLCSQQVRLTLYLGEAEEFLPQCENIADAWFLDGFTPSRNSSLWSQESLTEIARLSAGGTSLSSYTAASKVRNELVKLGFEIKKRKGFGSKREMICGEFKTKNPNSRQRKKLSTKHVCILGAGLAGVSLALSLLSRGLKVTLLERHAGLAKEASGNHSAVVMAYLSSKPDFLSRFYLSGFQHTLRTLSELEHNKISTSFIQSGVLRLTSSKRLASVYQALESLKLPREIVTKATKELEELDISSNSLLFPLGGYLEIKALCNAIVEDLKEQYQEKFSIRYNSEAIELKELETSWSIQEKDSSELCQANAVILANAFDAVRLQQSAWLPLEKVRGEVIHLPASEASSKIKHVVCADSYFTPAYKGTHLIGASYEHGAEDAIISKEQQEKLLIKIGQWSPQLKFSKEQISSGRVSFRSMSPDRLPMIGAIAKREEFKSHYTEANDGRYGEELPRTGLFPNLFASVGHGSRGTISCFLAAEIIASEICEESSPLEADLLRAVNPSRFLLRATRRS